MAAAANFVVASARDSGGVSQMKRHPWIPWHLGTHIAGTYQHCIPSLRSVGNEVAGDAAPGLAPMLRLGPYGPWWGLVGLRKRPTPYYLSASCICPTIHWTMARSEVEVDITPCSRGVTNVQGKV